MARISALVHFSMPWRNAGSERVLDELLTEAVNAGHEVTCVVTDCGLGPVVELNGYRVERVRNVTLGANRIRRQGADVIVSHHQNVQYGIRQARLMNARSVFLVHNDMDLNKRPLAMRPDLTVFNTVWVRESLARFPGVRESMVLRPPVDASRHRVDSTGDAITLVNLNEHKGSSLFYRLAELEPHRRFIGVVGGHGKQIIRRDLPNVEIWDHDPDMTKVWAQTRVLLMPSIYESYGLVAAEAAVSGIPTVAHPTPGLRENLGDAGIYADRDDVEAWLFELACLDVDANYQQASGRVLVKAISDRAQTLRGLAGWRQWLAGC